MKQASNEHAKVGQKVAKEFGMYGLSSTPIWLEIVEVLDKDEFGFHKVKLKVLSGTTDNKQITKLESRIQPITLYDVDE